MKVKIFTPGKNKTTVSEKSIDLSSEIFNAKLNEKVIAQAAQAQLANRQRAIAHTKDRSEVSGGGRKPFRQKGTGRARAGSSRSPIWIGGGVTFGPKNSRNFSKRLPQKMLTNAIFMAISEKQKNNKLIIVPELKISKIKTSEVQAFLETLPIEEGKILVVLDKTNVNLELSAANLPYIKVIQVENINLLDILKYDYLLLDVASCNKIEIVFGVKK